MSKTKAELQQELNEALAALENAPSQADLEALQSAHAALQSAHATLQDELHTAQAELQETKDDLADVVSMLEAAETELAALQIKAKPTPAPAPALQHLGSLVSSTGVFVVGAAFDIDQQWIHPGKARSAKFGIDVWGDQAEYLAKRNAPNGYTTLADGTFRVEARSKPQYDQIYAHIDKFIKTNADLPGKTFVARSPLGASSVKAKDAARAGGAGLTSGPSLVSLLADTVQVYGKQGADGKITELVIRKA